MPDNPVLKNEMLNISISWNCPCDGGEVISRGAEVHVVQGVTRALIERYVREVLNQLCPAIEKHQNRVHVLVQQRDGPWLPAFKEGAHFVDPNGLKIATPDKWMPIHA